MNTSPQPARPSGERRAVRSGVTGFAVALIGSAVLGLPAGLIWGEAAPRALLQEIGTGTAEVVNVETSAFIGADAWFCGIAAVAGLITGLLGYRFLVAPRAGGARAATAAGLILGGLAGAFVLLWLGEQIGLSAYQHLLASSPNGTMFNASLSLGAKSAFSFWPMLTAIVILIAEWSGRRTAEPAGPQLPLGYGAPPGTP
jgi:hypothetical protein